MSELRSRGWTISMSHWPKPLGLPEPERVFLQMGQEGIGERVEVLVNDDSDDEAMLKEAVDVMLALLKRTLQ